MLIERNRNGQRVVRWYAECSRLTGTKSPRQDRTSDLKSAPCEASIQQNSAIVASLTALFVSLGLLEHLDLIRRPCDKIIGGEADSVVPRRLLAIYKTVTVVWKSIALAHEDGKVYRVS